MDGTNHLSPYQDALPAGFTQRIQVRGTGGAHTTSFQPQTLRNSEVLRV